MYIAGITGPTGAGKTIAMLALKKHGALLLDCDEIYHSLLSSNRDMTEEIKTRFNGIEINGRIDRKKLGELVYQDRQALKDLENITHKYIISEVENRVSEHKKQGGSMAVIDAIALIESGLSKKCNAVFCVTAPRDIRISRLMERDNISREDALARINAQKPDSFYIENSDYVLNNTYENLQEFEDICMNTILIDKWFAGHTDEMIAELGRLVAINSVRSEREDGAPYGQNSRKALQLGQDLLEKHGFEVSVYNDMVITATLGPNPPKLGILTHLDIVEAGEHWDTDPFELTVKDGRLYGRGVMDNKGPAVASMYAAYCVRELFPDLAHGVQLIFGSGEETGFDDIAQYMRENTMPPDVFSPDGGFPLINVEKGRFMPVFGAMWDKDTALPRIVEIKGGKTPNIVPNSACATIEGISGKDAAAFCEEFTEKTGVELSVNPADDAAPPGTGRLTVTAKGTASHASRPQLGNNAQTALVNMLAAMPFAGSKGFDAVRALARLFPHGDIYGNAIGLAAQDEISGITTVNFGVLRYDEYEFSACFDARTAVCADENDLLAMTRDALKREGFEISFHELKRSHHTPEDSPFVQTLLRIYGQYTGNESKCICMGGLTYVHDIPGGVAFGCTMPGDDNNVHGANEFLDIDQLVLCAKMFASAIVEICGKN